jgi:hypothetical protein
MGFAVAGVFGPSSLEAGDIDKLAKTGSTMIIDNHHNPVGLPLAKVTTRAVYKQLLNFPGLNQTVSLLDVIRFNIRQLESAGENIPQ